MKKKDKYSIIPNIKFDPFTWAEKEIKDSKENLGVVTLIQSDEKLKEEAQN